MCYDAIYCRVGSDLLGYGVAMTFYLGTRVSKYRAIRTEVDGIKFASKKEASYYQQLMLLQKAGQIRALVLQKSWPLKVNDELICVYRSDFDFDELRNGQWVEVTADAKGFKTPEYKIKKKLMKAIYGIEIREV